MHGRRSKLTDCHTGCFKPSTTAAAGAVPRGWGSSQGGARHCPPAPRSPESPPAGRAPPAKQKARSKKGLKHRESSSYQTLHLLHLKNYLASLLPLPRPLPPCTRPAPSASHEYVGKKTASVQPLMTRFLKSLLYLKEMRQQLVL